MTVTEGQAIAQTFQRVMTPLLEKVGLAASDATPSAYRLRVDGRFDLHFFADPQACLVVVCKTGPLPEPAPPELLPRLLQLNTYAPLPANVSVGLDREDGKLQVWSRRPLAELEAEGIGPMVQLMVNAVSFVDAILAGRAVPEPPPVLAGNIRL